MMPTSTEILAGLTALANDWRGLAVAWHLFFGALLLGLAAGWRPSRRLAGVLLAAPLASASVLAWTAGNPFNGTAFAMLSLGLAGLAARLRADPITIAPPGLAVPGALLVAFGWVYPHFLRTGSWLGYVYAAPLGLLPCPTLSAVIGLSLVFNLLGSRTSALVLSTAGVVYGVIGAFRLDVSIDLVLLAGAIWTGLVAFRMPALSWSPAFVR